MTMMHSPDGSHIVPLGSAKITVKPCKTCISCLKQGVRRRGCSMCTHSHPSTLDLFSALYKPNDGPILSSEKDGPTWPI